MDGEIPMRLTGVLGVLFALLFVAKGSAAAEKMSLSGYLEQVKEKNHLYRSTQEKKEGAARKASEADLLTSPTFFSNATYRSDGKLPQLPLFTYDRLETHNFSLGVSQTTTFGLAAKLAYELDYLSYVNSSLQATAAAQGIPLTFYDARPVLELSQSLWQNGFGASTRAAGNLIRETSSSERYAAIAEADILLIEAEAAYWRLAFSREIVEIQKAALKHAQAIFDYVHQRDQRNLGDRADTLQAKALLQSRKLELKAAEDEAEIALNHFNTHRNTEGAIELEAIDWDNLEQRRVPAAFTHRADVKAAEAHAKAVAANVTIQIEKYHPTLDLVGSLALNGRNAELGSALGNSYNSNRPTYAVGLRFALPLDISSLTTAREGALQMEKAAELAYRQKLAEQKTSFDELSTKIASAKERMRLVREIEDAQKTKLDYERVRLRQGRTTTYQILMFEQDFLQAELARTRTAAELLNLFAQMRLYEGDAR